MNKMQVRGFNLALLSLGVLILGTHVSIPTVQLAIVAGILMGVGIGIMIKGVE